MGASGWSYFVPYDTDPVAALRALHAQVRKSGKYYKGGEEEGTHSILDVNKVAPAPVPRAEKVGFGVVAALPDDELVVILGTARPTRATIEAKQDALQSIRKRWSGTYIVVYENDAPKELFFTGFSGD